MRRYQKVLFSCFAALLAAAGCEDKPRTGNTGSSSQPRLVMLYATCTLGQQYLSPYNDSITFTPYLEKFAAQSKVLMKHRTEAGFSGVSYASIFTGNQAVDHGIMTHPTIMSSSLYDITEAFSDAGYESFYWGAHPMASIDLNYAQAVKPDKAFNKHLLHRDKDYRRILKKLKSDPSYKAFILVSFSVTHGPYKDRLKWLRAVQPDTSDRIRDLTDAQVTRYRELYYEYYHPLRYDLNRAKTLLKLSDRDLSNLSRVIELLYISNVCMLDTWFGKLVAAIDAKGLRDSSLIVFTSDHGESMYDELAPFQWSHGHALRAAVLDVPLLIRGPTSAFSPGSYDHVTRSIDVYPTLVGLAGLDVSDRLNVKGIDLSSVLTGADPEPSLTAFSHTGMMPSIVKPHEIGQRRALLYPRADMELTWVSLRKDDRVWKYRNPEGLGFVMQAYDLAADPFERLDIFDSDKEHDQRMRQLLEDYKKSLVEAQKKWESIRTEEEILGVEEQLNKLKGLNYVR